MLNKQTEYVERLSEHLLAWDLQISLLREKSKHSLLDTQCEYATTIDNLQYQRNIVALKLLGISSAKNDEWEELQTGTEQALVDIRAIFFNAVTKLI